MTATDTPKTKRANLPLPEKYAISGSEDSHQIALFMWASHPITQERFPELKRMFHVPNGGSRHKGEAGKLRAMGVKRGVGDIWLPVRRGAWPLLIIELKRPAQKALRRREGRTNDEQKDWIAYFKTQGYAACICVGWTEARDTIIQYLEWKELGNGY